MKRIQRFHKTKCAAERYIATLGTDARFYHAYKGIPTTRSTIYNWVFLKKIPFKKIGRRTVFSKKELLAWIESRTTLPEDRRAVAAARIAESANCK